MRSIMGSPFSNLVSPRSYGSCYPRCNVQLYLDAAQVRQVWDCLVAAPVEEADRALAFAWFHEAVRPEADFEPPVQVMLFNDLFLHLPPALLNVDACASLRILFGNVNQVGANCGYGGHSVHSVHSGYSSYCGHLFFF